MRSLIALCVAGLVWQGVAGAAETGLPEGWATSPANDRAPGQAGYRIVHVASGVELLYVPGGSFTMGSDDQDAAYALEHLGATRDMLRDEHPAHQVRLSGYWVGRTEVTVGQWRKVIGALPAEEDERDWNNLGPDHPVVAATGEEVQEFCRRLGLRLPTEAEWEYAARGPAQHRFPWGSEWDGTRCLNGANRGPQGKTLPVGSFPVGASWCGVLDMTGSVWEYCQDWYGADYYAGSPEADPQGPTEAAATEFRLTGRGGSPLAPCKMRVTRGGSWRHDYRNMYRGAYRRPQDPRQRTGYVGFRMARSAE